MVNFFSNLFTQFSNYIVVGLALVVVGLGIWLGVTKAEVSSLTVELGSAKQEIQNQKVEISSLNLKNQQQLKAIAAIEKRANEKAAEAATLATKLSEIDNAPETEDGPLADVLCRAITGSVCLRTDLPVGRN